MNMAKLTKTGEYQPVTLPKGFGFKGNEVYIKRVGRNILLIPKDDPWESLISSLDNFSDDFMDIREQPPIKSFLHSCHE